MPGSCYLKLSHFSDTSAGDNHGYNANGPKSPSKLSNSRFQTVVCSCFIPSHCSEFCSVQKKFMHVSYIKKDREPSEFSAAPGARQVEAGGPVMLPLTVLWWHLSLVFMLFTGKFQITSVLMNAKQHSDCTLATAQRTDFDCSWAEFFRLEAVWPTEGFKQQLGRSWQYLKIRTEEDKMEAYQNLQFVEKVRTVLWNLSLNYIRVCVFMYAVAYYECLFHSMVKNLKAIDLDQRLANCGSQAKSNLLPLVSMGHKLRMAFHFLIFCKKSKEEKKSKEWHLHVISQHIKIMWNSNFQHW